MALNKYLVTTGRGIEVPVEADYYWVEDGAITFKRAVPGSYPERVATFAPGAWGLVRRLPDEPAEEPYVEPADEG